MLQEIDKNIFEETMNTNQKIINRGKGIGIDIWTEGSCDNYPEAFQENTKIEGVTDHVSMQNEDVRRLPYENESLEVIISSLTMHQFKI
jgi:hypothetical protein